MKKKLEQSYVKTPYMPEELGNTREYNGNELQQRNPKKRVKNVHFRANLEKFVKIQK